MVARTRRSVTICVHCLSCCVYCEVRAECNWGEAEWKRLAEDRVVFRVWVEDRGSRLIAACDAGQVAKYLARSLKWLLRRRQEVQFYQTIRYYVLWRHSGVSWTLCSSLSRWPALCAAARSFIVSQTQQPPTQSLSVLQPPPLHPHFITVTTKTSSSVIWILCLFTFAFIFCFPLLFLSFLFAVFSSFPSFSLFQPFFATPFFDLSISLSSFIYSLIVPLISFVIYLCLSPFTSFLSHFLLFLKFFVFIFAILFSPLLFLCFFFFFFLVPFFVVF
jgi:hypothetical protein